MSESIREKLDDMVQSRVNLENAYKLRKDKLDQCLDLQFFIRDCETAEQWMKSRENALKDDDSNKTSSNSKANVEAAIKRHEDFDRAINAQEEKISNLQLFAQTLISNDHYDRENVSGRINHVLDRWAKLRNALIEHRSKLCESQTLQDFSRDADEIESWITKMAQTVSNENVDSTNIQVRTFSL
jgi:spectrin alpha